MKTIYFLYIHLIFLTFMPCMHSMTLDEKDRVVSRALQAKSMNEQSVRALEKLQEQDPAFVHGELSRPRIAYTVPNHAQFSPDGKHIAYFTNHYGLAPRDLRDLPHTNLLLTVASALTKKVQNSVPMLAEHFRSFRWSPRGTYITVNGWKPNTRNITNVVYRTTTLEQLRQIEGDISFSPQETFYFNRGKTLITETGETYATLHNYEVEFFRYEENLLEDKLEVKPTFLFSPNDRYIIVRNKKFCTIIDLPAKKELDLDYNHYAKIGFLPDELHVVFANRDCQTIDIYSLNDGKIKKIPHGIKTVIGDTTGDSLQIQHLFISRDGQKVGLLYEKKNENNNLENCVTVIDIKTEETTIYENTKLLPPNLDWNPERNFNVKNMDNSQIIYDDINHQLFSPDGTFAMQLIFYHTVKDNGLFLEQRDFSVISQINNNGSRRDIVFEWKHNNYLERMALHTDGIHPSNMLFKYGHNGRNNHFDVIDLLHSANLSFKELFAFRLLQNNLKNRSPVCQTAVGILKASSLKFLQDFAQEVEETNAVAPTILPAALAAAATTKAEHSSASSSSHPSSSANNNKRTKKERRDKKREAFENQFK